MRKDAEMTGCDQAVLAALLREAQAEHAATPSTKTATRLRLAAEVRQLERELEGATK